MRVLGIDPGSHHTGYGVVELQEGRLRLLSCGTLSPGSSLPLARRLGAIHLGLAGVVRELRPEAVSIEEVFHAANARSALVLGQARGAALAAAAAIDVHEYAPSEIKRAVTGNGRAGKEQVARMVAILVGGEFEGDEHACDALAAAICHVHRAKNRAPGASARRGRAKLPEGIKFAPAVTPPRGSR